MSDLKIREAVNKRDSLHFCAVTLKQAQKFLSCKASVIKHRPQGASIEFCMFCCCYSVSLPIPEYDMVANLVIKVIVNPGKSIDNLPSRYRRKLRHLLPQRICLQVQAHCVSSRNPCMSLWPPLRLQRLHS